MMMMVTGGEGGRQAVLTSDWLKAGLGIFPDRGQLPSSFNFTDSNSPKNAWWKAKIHQNQYLMKTCMKISPKNFKIARENF